MQARPIPDILVGVATYREINTKTVGAIHQMQMVLRDVRWGYTMTDTVNVPMARNMMARGFLDMPDADFLFFIDQDMVFEPDDAQRLIHAMQDDPEVGCMSGFYVKRDGTQVPLCAWFDEDKPWVIQDNDRILDKLEKGRGSIVDADVIPTGFMLIRREALESVKEPWFHILYPTMDNGEISPDMWSSDTVFCNHLQKAGWKTQVHLGIEVGHIGDFVYHPQHFWKSLPTLRSLAQRDAIKQGAANEYGVNSSGYWDSVWYAEKKLGINRDYKVLHTQMAELVPDGSRVLDIGCGRGQFIEMLRDTRDCNCTGFDHSLAAVKEVKENGFEARVFDINTDSLSPSDHHAFDVVVTTEVVEHFEDEKPLLKLCHQALKPGGTFLLSCPANCQGPAQEPEHVRVISNEEVAGWFEHYQDFSLGKCLHYWVAVGTKRSKK